jgi:hypothetical protein
VTGGLIGQFLIYLVRPDEARIGGVATAGDNRKNCGSDGLGEAGD